MFLDNILLVKALNFSLNICHSETPRLTEASAIRKDTWPHMPFVRSLILVIHDNMIIGTNHIV
jgi:hypothetical protein